MMQLLGRCHPALIITLIRLDVQKIHKAAYPNHKELIEIARKNRRELQPLVKRHCFILHLFEDTLIKPQP